ALLSCLRDTNLKPTNIPFHLIPGNLVPGGQGVGDRTNRGEADRSRRHRSCHLLCLLSRLVNCSRAKRPEGSGPTFVGGERPLYLVDYRPAFACSLLLYRPPSQALLRSPFLFISRRVTGLPRSAEVPSME